MNERMSQEISDSLEPLFREAYATGKWFHCHYQNLWFSPAELAKEQANGRFRWGAVNWTLRDPLEYLAEAARRASDAQAEFERIKKKVTSSASTAQSS